MAIAAGNRVQLSDNGSSAWVKIPANGDLNHPSVQVGNGNNAWGGSTAAALEFTLDPSASEVLVSPVKKSDAAISFTGNDYEVLEQAQGYVRITVTDYSGSEPISLHVA